MLTRFNYPSVTEIISYSYPPQFFCTSAQLEAARKQGEANHNLVYSYFENNDTYGIEYLKIFDMWFRNSGLENPICENRVTSEAMKFTGQPDMYFTSGCIIDLKRTIGQETWRYSLQLAGYSLLISELGIDCEKWKVIQIMKTKVKELDVYDENAAKEFLTIKEFYYDNR